MSCSFESGSRGAVDLSLRSAVVAVGERWASGQRDLVGLVVDLDASGEWALDGATSCAHWIADALDIELCTAREWLRIGRSLRELPAIAAAFAAGAVSYSKVRALTRVATPANEDALARLAQRVPASRLGHAVSAWLADNETPEMTEIRHQRSRSFSSRLDVDGMIVGTFRLPPLEGKELQSEIDARTERYQPRLRDLDASADAPPVDGCSAATGSRWPSLSQQRADAFLDLLRGGGIGVAKELVLHVRGDGCSLDDGTPIAGSLVERIAPEAFIRALIYDAERRPINASSRQRHPTERQRRVVRARDRRCVDCGSAEFLQYDHEPDYEQSRHTVVEELRLRCRSCHRERHRRLREGE
jgi:hypothetical protein